MNDVAGQIIAGDEMALSRGGRAERCPFPCSTSHTYSPNRDDAVNRTSSSFAEMERNR